MKSNRRTCNCGFVGGAEEAEERIELQKQPRDKIVGRKKCRTRSGERRESKRMTTKEQPGE